MRKVVCINSYIYPQHLPLTIGKQYTVLDEQLIPQSPNYISDKGPYYLIIADDNFQRWSLNTNFRELNISEIREEKLNQIL